MAAECAHNALLKKVVDNGQDAGTDYGLCNFQFSLVVLHDFSLMDDNLCDAEKFRSDLMNIAMTTLSSKILSQDKEHFANMAVDAVMRLKVESLNPFSYKYCKMMVVLTLCMSLWSFVIHYRTSIL